MGGEAEQRFKHRCDYSAWTVHSLLSRNAHRGKSCRTWGFPFLLPSERGWCLDVVSEGMHLPCYCSRIQLRLRPKSWLHLSSWGLQASLL